MRRDGTAFDTWLKRSLVEHFGPVVEERIPDELLRLLNDAEPSA